MPILRNIKLKNPSHNYFLLDVFANDDNAPKPVIIFSHGYKGFKDWGAWDKIAQHFAEAGYIFIKYNFSHNGTTLDNPLEFDDLEAFGNNTYTKELEDLETVINWSKSVALKPYNPSQKMFLIGHSRGGGISVLKGSKNKFVNAVASWATVDSMDYAMKDEAQNEHWKKDGVKYVINGRTKQNMPHYISFYNDFMDNAQAYSIQAQAPNMKADFIILHGDNDVAVPLKNAQNIHAWYTNSKLVVIENCNHVFGMSHPYNEADLPRECQVLLKETLAFFEEL